MSEENKSGGGAQGKRPEEHVGRALGKLFGRLRRTKTWRRSEQAYQDAVEGKDEPESPGPGKGQPS